MRGKKNIFWGAVFFVVFGMGGGLYYILKSQQEALIPEEPEPVSIASEASPQRQALIQNLKEKIRAENAYYIVFDFPVVDTKAGEKNPGGEKSLKKGE